MISSRISTAVPARLYFGGRSCESVEQLRLPTEMRLVDS
jgi:hypothetical protein